MALSCNEALSRLSEARDAGRLGHAYLVCGPRGSGKSGLVESVSAAVLGVDPSAVGKHPDFHSEGPGSKSRRILVDQMRRLEHAIREKPAVGPRKVAVIREADRMQPQAANAFLKTLEEPPAGTHLFLTTAHPGALLDTIVSRCIAIHLMAEGTPDLPDAERALVATLESLVAGDGSDAPPTLRALRMARAFLEALAAEREAIRDEMEAAFKDEQAHYKQSTDGTWLKEREEQLKAMAEAGAVRRRTELLHAVAAWFGDALRVGHGAGPDRPSPALARAAASLPAKSLLRAVDAAHAVASDLDRNVHEPLAVEAGFLKLFSVLR